MKKQWILTITLALGLLLTLGAMLTTGRWHVLAQALGGEATRGGLKRGA